MPETTTEFVIVTRFFTKGNKFIKHVYGGFSTRAKAETARKNMIKDMSPEDRFSLDSWVSKIIRTAPDGSRGA